MHSLNNALVLRDRGSKRAKILDSMLGQTNMMIASSTNLEEAFELIQEVRLKCRQFHAAIHSFVQVIKQDHRNAEAYRQISFIYGLKKDKAKYLQYGLLAAFLDNRTKAEDWCTWGNEALELDMRQEASACYGKGMCVLPRGVRTSESDWGNFNFNFDSEFSKTRIVHTFDAISCTFI